MPPLLLTKHRLHIGDNKFEFLTSQQPAKVSVDPCHAFIDRVQKDNS
ncbi:hypothetical protein GCM10022409_16390 [Hymenobacter glaciei]|uniref:Uncharacterized protein n=1 Tax=Hymenobacter glaciei TaxID=877209 RepID=A0ABP7TY94_9BACT